PRAPRPFTVRAAGAYDGGVFGLMRLSFEVKADAVAARSVARVRRHAAGRCRDGRPLRRPSDCTWYGRAAATAGLRAGSLVLGCGDASDGGAPLGGQPGRAADVRLHGHSRPARP